MDKKEFLEPIIKVVLLEEQNILANSYGDNIDVSDLGDSDEEILD